MMIDSVVDVESIYRMANRRNDTFVVLSIHLRFVISEIIIPHVLYLFHLFLRSNVSKLLFYDMTRFHFTISPLPKFTSFTVFMKSNRFDSRLFLLRSPKGSWACCSLCSLSAFYYILNFFYLDFLFFIFIVAKFLPDCFHWFLWRYILTHSEYPDDVSSDYCKKKFFSTLSFRMWICNNFCSCFLPYFDYRLHDVFTVVLLQ